MSAEVATERGRRILQVALYLLALGLVGAVVLGGNPRTMVRAASRQVRGVVHRGPQDKPQHVITWTVEGQANMAKVKTAVTRTQTPITGALKLYNQRTSGDAETCGPTWSIAIGAGNVVLFASRVYYDYNASLYAYVVPYSDPPMVWFIPEEQAPTFAEGEVGYMYGLADGNETTGPSGTWPAPVLVKLASGTNSLTLNYSMQFGCQRLYRERTSSPSTGRDASPVYAKETKVEDSWVDVDHPWTYNVSLGSITWTGTQAWTELVPDEWGWWPFLAAPGGVQMFFCQHEGTASTTYADISALVNGEGLDFTGGSKTYEEFTLSGDGDTVTLECDSNGDIASQSTWMVTNLWPLMINFAGVSAKDRGLAAASGLRVSGGFKADPRYPETLDWSTTP